MKRFRIKISSEIILMNRESSWKFLTVFFSRGFGIRRITYTIRTSFVWHLPNMLL